MGDRLYAKKAETEQVQGPAKAPSQRKPSPVDPTRIPLWATLAYGNQVPPSLRLSVTPPSHVESLSAAENNMGAPLHQNSQAVSQEEEARQEGVELRQHQKNMTGLPDALKIGIEQRSGLSMDGVQVHYHSSKPAEVEALAYTQGTEIHMGPGQEQHLAHETWHVVQQMQGRVQPTTEVGKRALNDDPVLEREADLMGQRVAAGCEQGRQAAFSPAPIQHATGLAGTSRVLQRVKIPPRTESEEELDTEKEGIFGQKIGEILKQKDFDRIRYIMGHITAHRDKDTLRALEVINSELDVALVSRGRNRSEMYEAMSVIRDIEGQSIDDFVSKRYGPQGRKQLQILTSLGEEFEPLAHDIGLMSKPEKVQEFAEFIQKRKSTESSGTPWELLEEFRQSQPKVAVYRGLKLKPEQLPQAQKEGALPARFRYKPGTDTTLKWQENFSPSTRGLKDQLLEQMVSFRVTPASRKDETRRTQLGSHTGPAIGTEDILQSVSLDADISAAVANSEAYAGKLAEKQGIYVIRFAIPSLDILDPEKIIPPNTLPQTLRLTPPDSNVKPVDVPYSAAVESVVPLTIFPSEMREISEKIDPSTIPTAKLDALREEQVIAVRQKSTTLADQLQNALEEQDEKGLNTSLSTYFTALQDEETDRDPYIQELILSEVISAIQSAWRYASNDQQAWSIPVIKNFFSQYKSRFQEELLKRLGALVQERESQKKEVAAPRAKAKRVFPKSTAVPAKPTGVPSRSTVDREALRKKMAEGRTKKAASSSQEREGIVMLAVPSTQQTGSEQEKESQKKEDDT